MLPLKDQIYWLREITDIYQAQIYLLYQPDIHDQIDQDAQPLIDNQKLGLLKPRFLIDGTTEIQCRAIYSRNDAHTHHQPDQPEIFLNSLLKKYQINHYLYLSRAASMNESNDWIECALTTNKTSYPIIRRIFSFFPFKSYLNRTMELFLEKEIATIQCAPDECPETTYDELISGTQKAPTDYYLTFATAAGGYSIEYLGLTEPWSIEDMLCG